jgi:hypothetical protein
MRKSSPWHSSSSRKSMVDASDAIDASQLHTGSVIVLVSV